MYRKQTADAGDGSIIVQVQGDAATVNLNRPHLALTRRMGLSRRIGLDPETKKPIETQVIRPFSRAIELVGRDEELRSLHAWLESEPPISIRVLTGEAGLGKTRLALELAEQAADKEWRAGFLTRRELARFLNQTNLAAWDWDAPVLAVVDYASASASALNDWLTQLVDHPVWKDDSGRDRPLRLLLLERHTKPDEGWWAETFRSGEGAGPAEMLDPSQPVALRRINDSDQRRQILTHTLARLGSDLKLPEDPDFERRLADLTWGGVPLLLMMAAVTAARVDFSAALALGAKELALDIAEHELERIRKVVEGHGVKSTLASLVDHVVAVATLRQGLSEEAARDVIETEAAALAHGLPDGSARLHEALAVALPSGTNGVAAVEPDMIGEALLLKAWNGKSHALAAIERAHANEPTTAMETVIRTCQDYLIRGERDPLTWLERIFDECVNSHTLFELESAIPTDTVELREFALAVSWSFVEMIRPHVNDMANASVRGVFARSLNMLSKRLLEVGRLDEALNVGRECVALYRELAAQQPVAFRPDLASSLNNLSNRLSEVGRREEALDVGRECVALYRELAAQQPERFRPDLALSLNNLSNRLSEVGRRGEAFAAAEYAARTLSLPFYQAPAAFGRWMATIVANYGSRCAEVGSEPDTALLSPIIEVLDRLNNEGAGQDHRE